MNPKLELTKQNKRSKKIKTALNITSILSGGTSLILFMHSINIGSQLVFLSSVAAAGASLALKTFANYKSTEIETRENLILRSKGATAKEVVKQVLSQDSLH